MPANDYEGLFIIDSRLDDIVQQILVETCAATNNWKMTKHKHITTSFVKGAPTLKDFPSMDKSIATVIINGYGYDKDIGIALSVCGMECENPSVQLACDVLSVTKVPHITIGVAPSVKPKDSYKSISSNFVHFEFPIKLNAIYTNFLSISES